MAFKHMPLLWRAKGVIMGHVGDTAFLPEQKKKAYHQDTWARLQKAYITTFGALGGLAFGSAYDTK